MAWCLSSENISLTSHPLWHHGLVINFRTYISWRHILYDSMAWRLSSENTSLATHPLWQHGVVINFRTYISWRHILYDSMAWWLISENISLASHPLRQHGLMVKFRKYIADVTSFTTAWPGGWVQKIHRLRHILYGSMAWWLISENISPMSHPLWQHGLAVKFRKYIACDTSFMTAWPGG